MDDRKKAVLFLGGGLLCFAIVWGLVRGFSGRWPWGTPTGVAGPSWSIRQSMKSSPDIFNESSPESVQPVRSDAPAEKWVVYITGEVARPGILEVSKDSRLYQAVEAAGGLTGKADKVGVNLAEKLSDGVHVHVPRVGETPGKAGILQEPGNKQLPEKGISSTSSSSAIDINHATAAELESLPGIGPKLAEQIVEDRTENGPFRAPEDLLRVKGIGPSKLEKMKELITVRP